MSQFMTSQTPDSTAYNTFSAYGENHVCVNAVRHEKNIIVMKTRVIQEWTHNDFDTLSIEDMQTLADLDAKIILFGTGRQLRFPRPELMRPLAEVGKTLDVMDFHAACRAYNLLSSEDREVAAVLLFD